MKTKSQSDSSWLARPTISGLGLVAFDYVTNVSGRRVHTQAGGTCGNVLAILAALGWHALPIARLKMDTAGQFVRADLEKFGVDTRWIGISPTAATPIIIERLLQDSTGVPFHCFSFYCPGCNTRLPRFQPVPARALDLFTAEAQSAHVVFIDRVSPSAFALAKGAFEAGALVFFEPSTVTSDRELERILPFTHVFKYSHERVCETMEIVPDSVALEIQTLGRGGLRFRMRSKQSRRLHQWAHMDSNPVDAVDSTGAGDWFSAALIHLLFKNGIRSARAIDQAMIVQALAKAQKLAAWSCSFVGARGAMYYSSITEIKNVLQKTEITVKPSRDLFREVSDYGLLCEICAGAKEVLSPNKPEVSILPRPH